MKYFIYVDYCDVMGREINYIYYNVYELIYTL